MKLVNITEPVGYIVFDNGAKMKKNELIVKLERMIGVDMMFFSKSKPERMAILELLKEHCASKLGRIRESQNPDTLYVCWLEEGPDAGRIVIERLIEKIRALEEEQVDKSNVFDDLPQYPVDRDVFAEIFRKVDDYACDGRLPFEGLDFKFWSHDDEVYMLHKPSGTLINWYKIGHTGRTNTCNKALTIDEYRKFADMLFEEIKEEDHEYGRTL